MDIGTILITGGAFVGAIGLGVCATGVCYCLLCGS